MRARVVAATVALTVGVGAPAAEAVQTTTFGLAATGQRTTMGVRVRL